MLHERIETDVATANTKIAPGARLHYFGPDTESGAARIVIYTDGSSHGSLVCVGTPRECWQYINGLLAGIAIA